VDLVEKISRAVPATNAPVAVGSASDRPKPPKRDREWMPWGFPVLVFGGVALLLFVYLGQFASMVRTQYKIVALRDKQRNLEREKIDLQLRIQQLTSLERVERIASGRLGMVTPPRREVVDMASPGAKVVGVGKNSTQAQ
jgi:cell division protein FtsL